MKAKRKSDQCLNCQEDLTLHCNYCTSCGQLNSNNDVSMFQLIGDFIDNYFGVDSKFLKSFPTFFIKPGHLTKEFNKGKRVTYVNPIRMYLLSSLFCFFMITVNVENQDTDRGPLINFSGLEGALAQFDSVRINLNDSIATIKADSIKDAISSNLAQNENISDDMGKQVLENLKVDVTLADSITDWTSNVNGVELRAPNAMKAWEWWNDKEISYPALIDSLNISRSDSTTVAEMQSSVENIRRPFQDVEGFKGYLLQNLPILMFFMLPLYALILKSLYLRFDFLYIKHFIHTLHIHSLAFIIIALNMAAAYLIEAYEMGGRTSFFLITTFIVLSFRTVYQQGWKKTFLKVFLSGSTYFFVLLFGLVLYLISPFIIGF